MSLAKFKPTSPDKNINRTKGDTKGAQYGHLNTIVDYINNNSAKPAGLSGYVQFNDNNALAGDAGLFWDNVNKRLGVGTVTPDTTLSVNGITGINNSLYLGNTNSFLSTNRFQILNSANTDIMVNVDSGGSISTNGRFQIYNSARTAIAQAMYYDGGTMVFRPMNDGVESTVFRNNVQDKTMLRFDGVTGNVDVGTGFTLGARLGVRGSGSTSATTALLVQNSAGNPSMAITDNGLVTFYGGTYMNAGSSNFFHTVDTGAGSYGGLLLRNSIADYAGYITTGRSGNQNAINFFHTTYAGTFSAAAIQSFSASNVTFGKSNGSSPNTLTVYGTPVFNITSSATINVAGSTNTTNTGAKLAFQCGTIDTGGAIDSGGIVVFKSNIGGTDNINTRMVFYNRQNTTLIERMRISDSGNLLIGTTTDTARLTLQGSGSTSATTSLLVQNSGGSVTPLRTDDDGTSYIGWDNTGAFNSYFSSNGDVVLGRYGLGLTYTKSLNRVRLCNNNFEFNGSTLYVGNAALSGSFLYLGGVYNGSAIVTLTSTTQGFLKPRMTTAQKNLIATPAAGLEIYDTDLNRPCFYNGSAWVTL